MLKCVWVRFGGREFQLGEEFEVSPPPPVDEQSHSVVPVDPGVISEACADMGALWGSLGWISSGWS